MLSGRLNDMLEEAYRRSRNPLW